MASPAPNAIGIDIGGSAIKGAAVDLADGSLVGPRIRIETPQPSTPAACAEVLAAIVDRITAELGSRPTGTVRPVDLPVGVTYPGVVKEGHTLSAANVDHAWLGLDAHALLARRLGRDLVVLNDAQAAAMAEVRYGTAAGHRGLVLCLTFGTGIGSGLVYRGVALPGIELGHMLVDGVDGEDRAAASVKDQEGLSWAEWSERVQRYLDHLECAIWPDLIVVGGGVSAEADAWLPGLRTRAPLVAAKLANDAGIVGAALATRSADSFR
jgi:polyphosphate glucokinase